MLNGRKIPVLPVAIHVAFFVDSHVVCGVQLTAALAAEVTTELVASALDVAHRRLHSISTDSHGEASTT
jgi:hypothetical protein